MNKDEINAGDTLNIMNDNLNNIADEPNTDFKSVPFELKSYDEDILVLLTVGGHNKKLEIKLDCENSVINIDKKVLSAIETMMNDVFNTHRYLIWILESYPDTYNRLKDYFSNNAPSCLNDN